MDDVTNAPMGDEVVAPEAPAAEPAAEETEAA